MTRFSMHCVLSALAAVLLSCASHPVGEEGVKTVTAPDGVAIAYETAGRGEPTLVFVHGWSCDRSYWRAQIDHFSKSRQVVAIDLGGHGASGLGREDWTMTAFGHDVRAVVEALDLRRVVLVGHSMGGPVIVEAARLMPDRMVGIVVADFFGDVGRTWTEAEVEEFLAPMRADFRGATDGLVRRFFAADSDPDLIEWVAADMAAGPPEVGVSAMANIWHYDHANRLAAVPVPVRLINADLWTTDVEAARSHKPDLELAVLPGVGHFLMMEDPQEFNRILARVVRELTGSR